MEYPDFRNVIMVLNLIRMGSTNRVTVCAEETGMPMLCSVRTQSKCPSAGDSPLSGNAIPPPPFNFRVLLEHVSPDKGTKVAISFELLKTDYNAQGGFVLEEISLKRDREENKCHIFNTSGARLTEHNVEDNGSTLFTKDCGVHYNTSIVYSVNSLPRRKWENGLQQAVVTIQEPFDGNVNEPGNWHFQTVVYNNSCDRKVYVEFLQMPDEFGVRYYRVSLLYEKSPDPFCSMKNCDEIVPHTENHSMGNFEFSNVDMDEEYQVQIIADDPYYRSPTKCLCQTRCAQRGRCLATMSDAFAMPSNHSSCQVHFYTPTSNKPSPQDIVESKPRSRIGEIAGLIIALTLVLLFAVVLVVVFVWKTKCLHLRKDTVERTSCNYDPPYSKYHPPSSSIGGCSIGECESSMAKESVCENNNNPPNRPVISREIFQENTSGLDSKSLVPPESSTLLSETVSSMGANIAAARDKQRHINFEYDRTQARSDTTDESHQTNHSYRLHAPEPSDMIGSMGHVIAIINHCNDDTSSLEYNCPHESSGVA